MALLSLDHVSKRHRYGRREVTILDDVSFEVEVGDFVGIWGAARSGKSSLLRLAAGIDVVDHGRVHFQGADLARLSQHKRALLLRRSIAFVPSALDPTVWRADRSEEVLRFVGAPLISDGWSAEEALMAAHDSLSRVGVAECAAAITFELSPSEQTRVALARGLIRQPELLLVDEPAVTQSPSQRDQIRDLLRQLSREPDMALVVASEDTGVLRGMPRMLSLSDGGLRSTDEPGVVVPFPPRSDRVRASGTS